MCFEKLEVKRRRKADGMRGEMMVEDERYRQDRWARFFRLVVTTLDRQVRPGPESKTRPRTRIHNQPGCSYSGAALQPRLLATLTQGGLSA